jgi:hypothetical protein
MAGWRLGGQETARDEAWRLWVRRTARPWASLTWAIHAVLGVKP